MMTWFPERIERVCRQPPERCRDLAWLHRGLSTVSGTASPRSWRQRLDHRSADERPSGGSSPGNGHGVGARRTTRRRGRPHAPRAGPNSDLNRYAAGRLRIGPCGIAISVGVLSGARQHEPGKRCHPRGAASRQGVPGPATPEPPGGRRSLRTTCGYRLTGCRCAPLVHVGCSLDGACAHRGVMRTTSRGTFGRDRASPGWVSGDWWWSARRPIGASAPRCTVPWLGATTRPSVGDTQTEDQTDWEAPPPDKVIAHRNLYWAHPTAPGRTTGTVDSKDVDFGGPI